MKYGKLHSSLAAKNDQFVGKYIDYKTLKRVLKASVGPEGACNQRILRQQELIICLGHFNFKCCLLRDLDKCNAFFTNMVMPVTLWAQYCFSCLLDVGCSSCWRRNCDGSRMSTGMCPRCQPRDRNHRTRTHQGEARRSNRERGFTASQYCQQHRLGLWFTSFYGWQRGRCMTCIAACSCATWLCSPWPT